MTRPRLPDLVLLRLLPLSRPLRPLARLVRDLSPFFRAPLDEAQVVGALAQLRDEGHVEARVLRLTEGGRARAIDLLGPAAADWRPGTRWPALRSRLLPRMVLGGRGPLATDELLGVVLARELGLPEERARSARAALEAFVCRAVGHPELASLEALFTEVIGAQIGARDLTAAEIAVQAPRVLLRVPRSDRALLCDRLLLQWCDPPPAELDLAAFAEAVRRAAREGVGGRFDPGRVFVGRVWDAVRHEPMFVRMNLDAFKQRLVEAQLAGLVSLSRADLVQLLDPAEVSRSETRGRSAVFHFVRVDADG